MSMNKQVRFEQKTTIINEKSNELITNSEMNSEQNGDEDDKCEEFKCKLIDSMWEKLVLYYLSRLKGLCDWRRNSKMMRSTSKKKCSCCRSRCSCRSIDSVESAFSEDDIINRITERTIKDCMKCKNKNLTDVSTFMAAGYEEGKQEAAKIVIRSLKYGLLTGILKKDGSVYKIRQKFMGNLKSRTSKCKLFRNTRRNPKRDYNFKINRPRFKHAMKLRTRKNERRNIKKCRRLDRNIYTRNTKQDEPADKSVNDAQIYPEITSLKKKNSSPSIPRKSSSRSASSTSSAKKNSGPSAKRKRSRIAIKRPVIRRPQRKKRGRSQTKSPTPSSLSGNSVNKYKPRKLNKFKSTSFKKYNTPKPRRHGSVLSAVSSTVSICTLCKQKRERELNLSDSSCNVKRVKSSIGS